ncbi:MAG: hypothetical protein QM702_10250 [Rubrivivax sp.]
MHLIQFTDDKGNKAVGVTEGGNTSVVTGAGSVYALAAEAAERGLDLRAVVIDKGLGATRGSRRRCSAKAGCWCRSITPISAHLYVTGTGLTHLGSASTRDAMHKSMQRPPRRR